MESGAAAAAAAAIPRDPKASRISQQQEEAVIPASGWSHLPTSILDRVLIRLDRDDVSRSCSVCRHWNTSISSDFFQRSYRKQLRNTPAHWTWLVSCITTSSNTARGTNPGTSSTGGDDVDDDASPLQPQLLAFNLHLRKTFKLMSVSPCPASRSHPKCCWFDFTSADNLVAWACRHTPTSLTYVQPLKPSTRQTLTLPPFPESVVYEFRLGLSIERDTNGFRLAVLRLGWPHAEGNTTPAALCGSLYRSSTRSWVSGVAKVKQEFKRWGASVVCRDRFYVLLRPPGHHGPMTTLVNFNMNGEAEEEFWSQMELPLPELMRYHWHTKMDLVDLGGTLVLVMFWMEHQMLRLFQMEEYTLNNRAVRKRWSEIGSMPPGICRQLGAGRSYRCRGFGDSIFISGFSNGAAGYVYSASTEEWQRVDLSGFRGDELRYLFALNA